MARHEKLLRNGNVNTRTPAPNGMATIAGATAGNVSGAENGSLRPGRMQYTAGVPAGNGPTEGGLTKREKADKTERLFLPRALRIKNRTHKKKCVYICDCSRWYHVFYFLGRTRCV